MKATRQRTVGVDAVQLASAADPDRTRHDPERDEPSRSRLHVRNDREQRERSLADDHGPDGRVDSGLHGGPELFLRSTEPIAASRREAAGLDRRELHERPDQVLEAEVRLRSLRQ